MGALDRALEHFAPVAPLSERTTATLLPRLPPPVQDLLARGVGYIGDGLLRTVDPASIARIVVDLADPIHASHSFPILTTAFGDVVTEWRSRLYLINARLGRYLGLGRVHHLGRVIAHLAAPAERHVFLGELPWAQAVHALGMPGVEECFAYVPPLSVLPRPGGDLTGLVRMDLVTHLRFLAAFHGPAQGQW